MARYTSAKNMDILEATSDNISEIAKLFDLYRQFYGCKPDIELAKKYIAERILNRESTIFIANDNGTIKGFVQMYPWEQNPYATFLSDMALVPKFEVTALVTSTPASCISVSYCCSAESAYWASPSRISSSPNSKSWMPSYSPLMTRCVMPLM